MLSKIILPLLLLLSVSCHEKILYEKGKSLPFSLQGKQTYEIEFRSKKEIPERVHINIASENSMQQIVSFSSTHPQCKNKSKFKIKNTMEQPFDILLEKKSFNKKKLYLCIQCASAEEKCDFEIKMDEIETGIKIDEYPEIEEEKTKEEPSTPFYGVDEDGEPILMATTTNVNLYVVDGSNAACVSLPNSSQYKTTYTISAASGSTFSVSGSSVTCTKGFVMPRNTTWYWYGGFGTTAKPGEGQVPTSIEISYTLGTSTVTVKSGTTVTATYVFEVKDYAEERADKIIDDYLATKITSGMTELEKLEVITAFPAQYPYNASYSGWLSMISCGGGDCWASTYTIQRMCNKIGITNHVRYGANSAGAGSGHRNIAALIDGKVYIAEAGYSGTVVPRAHSVYQENVGWYYSVSSSKATIKQYDGFLTNIVVPSTIDGYTVVGLGTKALYWGQAYSGMTIDSVTLPSTLTTIGDSAFNSLKLVKSITVPAAVTSIGDFVFTNMVALTSISVASGSTAFASSGGALYNKALTKILYYPSGRTTTSYSLPSTLTTIGYYAFYYTNYVSTVHVPKTVTSIEEGAFGTSVVKQIYFYGPQPTFTTYCFHGLNFTAYYPTTSSWDTANIDLYNAKAIKWVAWTPTTFLAQKLNFGMELTKEKIYKIVGACLSGLILSIAIVAYLVMKRKQAVVENENTINVDGLITA